jgi:NAD/NADP transhydrogenase alpha subunit
MSVSVNYAANVTVQETLETNPDSSSASQRVVTHSLFNSSHALNGSSTPPATKVAAFKLALVAGAGAIDLTALVGTNGAVVDGTGLKVQAIKVKNVGANALTITKGATNGYALAGASMNISLLQNQEVTLYGNDATPDVASGVRILDLAGTLVQESQWIIVLG